MTTTSDHPRPSVRDGADLGAAEDADRETLRQIHQLVARQHTDRADPDQPGAHEDLVAVQEALDQCWDLLRQRRALREARLNASNATARPTGTVEGYLQ